MSQTNQRHNSNGSESAISNGPSPSVVVVNTNNTKSKSAKNSSRYNKVYFNYLFQRCLVQCRSYNSALIAILIICVCCTIFCFPAYLLGRINCKVYNETAAALMDDHGIPGSVISNETCNFTYASNQKHIYNVDQDQGALMKVVFYSQAILVKFIPCILLVTFSSLLINSLIIINRNNKRLRKSSTAAFTNLNAKKLAKLNKLEKSAQKRAANNRKKTAKRLQSNASCVKEDRPHSKSLASEASALTIESFARNMLHKMSNQTQLKSSGRNSGPNLTNSISEMMIVNEVDSKKSIPHRKESFKVAKPVYDTLVEQDGLENSNSLIKNEPPGHETHTESSQRQATSATTSNGVNELNKSRTPPVDENLNNKACQTRSSNTSSSLKKKLMKLKQSKMQQKDENGDSKPKIAKTKSSSAKIPKRNRTKEHLRTTLMLVIVSVLFLLTEFPQAVLISCQ